MVNNSVLINRIELAEGGFIGHLTINREQALNALDMDVVKVLSAQLSQWQHDKNILAVLLDSAGDKAFCAGGDVVSMHSAMVQAPRTIPEPVKQFFVQEYELDYLIHSYIKPIIVWGNGIVMGGGLGLFAAASHAIVTETSKIAMPEVTIGLYPDVGASYFLTKMPAKVGRFLGMTGAQINGTDSLFVGLAQHFIKHSLKSALLDKLCHSTWSNRHQENFSLVSGVCDALSGNSDVAKPVGNVESHLEQINAVICKSDIDTTYSQLSALQASSDKWLQRAAKTFLNGSPLTIKLVNEQLHRSEGMSLASCFQMELILSCRCSEYGEFAEGVRALLIDKDNQPNWKFKSIKDVPDTLVNSFFSSPWGEEHPLAFLEE
jgi:enoyl-CoA hydratase/carnithine racemase